MKNIEKAAQIIKLLVLDVDGVMTDGSIYLDAEQELFKSFNAKDVWESAAL
jgi:3-deoxy-D-manno-octulosonate 8-phosphate phosphatase (KDO 8-P phosphatase)